MASGGHVHVSEYTNHVSTALENLRDEPQARGARQTVDARFEQG